METLIRKKPRGTATPQPPFRFKALSRDQRARQGVKKSRLKSHRFSSPLASQMKRALYTRSDFPPTIERPRPVPGLGIHRARPSRASIASLIPASSKAGTVQSIYVGCENIGPLSFGVRCCPATEPTTFFAGELGAFSTQITERFLQILGFPWPSTASAWFDVPVEKVQIPGLACQSPATSRLDHRCGFRARQTTANRAARQCRATRSKIKSWTCACMSRPAPGKRCMRRRHANRASLMKKSNLASSKKMSKIATLPLRARSTTRWDWPR